MVASIPLGQKLYLRPTWRDRQKRPGRLDPEEYWKVALAAARRKGDSRFAEQGKPGESRGRKATGQEKP